jgi:hypothetical protein
MNTAPAGRDWRTSSYSGTQENCVEIATGQDGMLIRDSKHRDAGTLNLDTTAAGAFLRTIRRD